MTSCSWTEDILRARQWLRTENLPAVFTLSLLQEMVPADESWDLAVLTSALYAEGFKAESQTVYWNSRKIHEPESEPEQLLLLEIDE